MKKNKPVSSLNNRVMHSISAEMSASCGSIKGKFPVVIDGGRTTIYISDKSREAEIIERYSIRKGR
ncbi:MAG: hypothetical protein H6541_13765 [Lentimicrobiaceae bacterium]|mgnify:FL=1|nr:hypothetical protein [Lentimicrobiaceae bacterium]MCO5265874.1 hypothetical protein [Lentimicrobium sp.]HPG32932.1 hypothetical protein [Lentimicrobium sp.]